MRKEVIVRENGSRRVIQHVEGESATRQEFKKETDINVIMKRAQKTGQITHVSGRMPFYGDATQITDYKSALDAIYQANETFMSLPSTLRNKFENDPAKLIAFLQDDKNRETAIEWGLIEKPKTPPSNPQDNQAPKE